MALAVPQLCSDASVAAWKASLKVEDSSNMYIHGGLPPDSPDIIPIEMCGPICDAKAIKKGCRILEEAREGVPDEVAVMPR
jgi:hypothetical protein